MLALRARARALSRVEIVLLSRTLSRLLVGHLTSSLANHRVALFATVLSLSLSLLPRARYT